MPGPKKHVKPKVEQIGHAKVKLLVPKQPLLYKFRRVQWVLSNYHRLMEQDILAVPFKDYMTILEKHEQLALEAKKLGLDTREGRKSARGVDPQGVGEGRDEELSDGAGPTLPPGMGAGI